VGIASIAAGTARSADIEHGPDRGAEQVHPRRFAPAPLPPLSRTDMVRGN
jgi:hypothetical protein